MTKCQSVVSTCTILMVLFAFAGGLAAQNGQQITNQRVIEMTQLGLDDDVIIARIKTGQPSFQLEDADLLSLKKSGVTGKVVAAMLDASVLSSSVVKIDGKVCELHTLGQAKVGGRLGNMLTGGVKSVKQKAYLQGERAALAVKPDATIEIELAPEDAIDNYIIVRMDPKDDRRELEVGSTGGLVGGKSGIRAESIVRTSQENISGRRYRVNVEDRLSRGEYILYVLGSADSIKGVYGKGYDFSVN